MLKNENQDISAYAASILTIVFSKPSIAKIQYKHREVLGTKSDLKSSFKKWSLLECAIA